MFYGRPNCLQWRLKTLLCYFLTEIVITLQVKLQDERAKTQRSLQKASWNSKREEYEELEKGRRALEEKVMEKISEGENAIKSHESQLDELTSSILTLEKEMSSVDNGLESAKSTADRQQVQDREQTAIQQTESLASEISLLLRELELENDKLVNLQQEIDNGKNLLANNEVSYLNQLHNLYQL